MSRLKGNIIKGLGWQSLSLAATFMAVPFSLEYLGNNDYGLWIAIYVTTLWLSNFDFGVPSSLRNLLAIAVAKKQVIFQRELISTSYFFVFIVTSCIVLVVIVANFVLFYGTDIVNSENHDYIILSSYLIFVISLDMVFKLILTIFTANQRAAILPACTGISNVFILISVVLLNKYQLTFFDSRVYTYALFIPLAPLIINFVLTCVSFSSIYGRIKPNFNYFSYTLLKRLLFLGFGFFLIQISMAIFTQISNIIIATLSEPADVTLINIAEKYFGLISIVGAIILFPFWSRFTEADANKEYIWTKLTLKKLEKLFILALILSFILFFVFPYFYRIWLGNDIFVPEFYSLIVMFKFLTILLNSIYSYYLNSIGKIRIQIIFYCSFAIFSYPGSYLLYSIFGTPGVIMYTCIGMLCMAFVQRIYAFKIIEHKISQ